ncbi:putative membrane domain protein [Escherichia coli 3006]|nr:putative membrane domain protein [Escherichia coli 3006]
MVHLLSGNITCDNRNQHFEYTTVKINTQQLFMLALAMIVIGFLGTCLFIYYIFVDN